MSEYLETQAAFENEYRALRRSGVSHKRAVAILTAAMAKAIPAAVNIVMDEIKQNGMPFEEFKAMAEGGWFDGDDPREAREIERHQREDDEQ